MIKTLKLVNSWSQLHSHSTTETHLEANESPEDEIQLKLKYGKKMIHNDINQHIVIGHFILSYKGLSENNQERLLSEGQIVCK